MDLHAKNKRFSLNDQAKALAIVLREEFGVSFTLYDGLTGEPLLVPDENVGYPFVESTVVKHLARENRADVQALREGRYQLALPLPKEDEQSAVLAVGLLPGFARTNHEMAQEQERLQKWLQAVADRLHPSRTVQRRREDSWPEAQTQTACQTILALDQLFRRIRIHREPGRHQQRILQSAADLLRIRTLAWIPRSVERPILVAGEHCLSTWDFRQLAHLIAQTPEISKASILVDDRPERHTWGLRFPQIRSLMGFALGEAGNLGIVLAINRRPVHVEGDATSPELSEPQGPPSAFLERFRRGDAAMLTPFVSLLEMHVRLAGRYREVRDLLVGLARSLTAAIDAKDTYTYGHSERVARAAVELGREMGLPEDEVNDIYLVGLLHDIGKIGVPDAILSKPGALSPEEFDQIKQHVIIGYRILQDLQSIRHLLPGVLYHHERYDGKGYPEGLAGEGIPQLARILAVADSFDAMSTSRPYRNALPLLKVEEILQQGAGTQWDPRVIEAYFRCRERIHRVRQRGIGESLCLALDTALRKDGSSILPPGSFLLPAKPTAS